ncbi:MAG TPA: hypothetical protein ENH10_10770 [Bacteroidetes bacterium]|nr:hypothetical protein [Bacteroidota bacterium]HEX05615.1 hypothetical protein [Bacteroidota bacterium]
MSRPKHTVRYLFLFFVLCSASVFFLSSCNDSPVSIPENDFYDPEVLRQQDSLVYVLFFEALLNIDSLGAVSAMATLSENALSYLDIKSITVSDSYTHATIIFGNDITYSLSFLRSDSSESTNTSHEHIPSLNAGSYPSEHKALFIAPYGWTINPVKLEELDNAFSNNNYRLVSYINDDYDSGDVKKECFSNWVDYDIIYIASHGYTDWISTGLPTKGKWRDSDSKYYTRCLTPNERNVLPYPDGTSEVDPDLYTCSLGLRPAYFRDSCNVSDYSLIIWDACYTGAYTSEFPGIFVNQHRSTWVGFENQVFLRDYPTMRAVLNRFLDSDSPISLKDAFDEAPLDDIVEKDPYLQQQLRVEPDTDLELSTYDVDMGSVFVGQTGTSTLSLSCSDYEIEKISITPVELSSPFSVPNCNPSYVTSVTGISIVFNPTAHWTYARDLLINTNAINTINPITIRVTGSGVSGGGGGGGVRDYIYVTQGYWDFDYYANGVVVVSERAQIYQSGRYVSYKYDQDHTCSMMDSLAQIPYMFWNPEDHLCEGMGFHGSFNDDYATSYSGTWYILNIPTIEDRLEGRFISDGN